MLFFLAGFLAIIAGYLLLSKKKRGSINQSFTLTTDGHCLFYGGEQWQLLPESRVSFLGCWLVALPLAQSQSLEKTPSYAFVRQTRAQYKFIFKDSLSPCDYARLTRVITAIKIKV